MPTPTPAPAETGEQLVGFFEGIWIYVRDSAIGIWEALPSFIVNLLLCFLIWVAAGWVIKLVSKKLEPLLTDDYKGYANKTSGQIHRARSVATLARSLVRYGVYFVAICFTMSILGIGDAGAIIAGAGVGGVALGFGAQSLVKDVISGLFMVFENQYSVGDYVRLSTPPGIIEGYIEAVAIRVTYMRDAQGRQYVIPNGTIDQVINCSRGSWLAVVEVSVAYEEDVSRAADVLLAVAREVAREMPEHVAGEPSVKVIDRLDASGVAMSVACPAQPTKNWELERRIRLRAKETFDSLGIELPYAKTVVLKPGPKEPNKDEAIRQYLERADANDRKL